MPYGRATPIVLNGPERVELEALVRRRNAPQGLALRARIVLRCAEGLTNRAVAGEVRVCAHTVGKWRERFAAARLAGLSDEPRSGAPRRIGDEAVAALVTRTLETMPAGATHWSRRSMARAAGLSASTVGRVWRAFGLRPHRSETFKLSTDPEFVEKVRDIVGLYLAPPTGRWSCAWTRRPGSRRSTGRSRSCRCAPAGPSGAPTTTRVTARPRSSRRSTSGPEP
jgi:transposase